MFAFIPQAAKSIAGFVTPWLVKGLTAGVAALGITDVTPVQIDNTATFFVSVVVGLIVYFVPNKSA